MSGYVAENFATLYEGICRKKNANRLTYFGINLYPPTTTQHSPIHGMWHMAEGIGAGTGGHAGKRGKMAQARNATKLKDLISDLSAKRFCICFQHILRNCVLTYIGVIMTTGCTGVLRCPRKDHKIKKKRGGNPAQSCD
jgi:hypothetical protein